jgi:hypothetical protein
MKTALITGLFAAFFISSAHAAFVKQTPPSKNEGSSLDDIISSYSQKALLQAMKGKGFNYKVQDEHTQKVLYTFRLYNQTQ